MLMLLNVKEMPLSHSISA